MKYQALILIFVILISSYILKQGDVFSKQEDGSKMQAQMLVTGSDIIENNFQESIIKGGSSEIKSDEEKIIVSNRVDATDIMEKTVIEPEISQKNCDGVGATIYLVKRLDEKTNSYEKNLSYRWPIASVTKLMTSIIALENLDLKSQVEITPEIKNAVGEYGSFAVGAKYTVNDLLKAGLVFSSNDAAFALSDAFGREAFIRKMNDKANEIGMSQTDFYEPSGLSYLNQSTIYDLENLMKYIYSKHPMILETTRTKSVSLKDLSTGKSKTFSNINQFVGQKNFFGGKTGYIDQSGGNLVTLFQKNGKISFVGVLGSQDRFGDVEKLVSCMP